MAKRKKTIIAGPIVKTIIYTAPEPQDGKRARAEKSKMTSAAQKAMNDKTARGRLEMLLAANFTGRDLFVTLGCFPLFPASPELEKSATQKLSCKQRGSV